MTRPGTIKAGEDSVVGKKAWRLLVVGIMGAVPVRGEFAGALFIRVFARGALAGGGYRIGRGVRNATHKPPRDVDRPRKMVIESGGVDRRGCGRETTGTATAIIPERGYPLSQGPFCVARGQFHSPAPLQACPSRRVPICRAHVTRTQPITSLFWKTDS